MAIIVNYQCRDMLRDEDKEFTSHGDAFAFADGVIEDGGHADVFIELEAWEAVPDTACVLAQVYISRASRRSKYELIDGVPTCRYCGGEGGCGC